MAEGIETRTDAKGRKRYRGVLNTAATGKVRSPWGTHAEAKAWRAKALGEVGNGRAQRTATTTLRDEWQAFIEGAEAGTIHDRTGKPYKPSTLRGYRRGWRKIDAELGAHRLTDIRRGDLQAMVDRWAAQGMAAQTIRNTLNPLQTLYRRAIQRDRVSVNPAANLDTPRPQNGRDRFATRDEAAELIAAAPEADRAAWAAAFYAGLRRGELRGLRWADVDLAAGLIHVRRSWDDVEGEIEPKSRGSVRRVPIVPALAAALTAHQAATGRSGDDLVFGRTASEPLAPTSLRKRALAAWAAAGLRPITLHEARHSFASLMIAAGANAKALSVVMGHATVSLTFDRYGHLMPGGEAEVGRLLADYLG